MAAPTSHPWKPLLLLLLAAVAFLFLAAPVAAQGDNNNSSSSNNNNNITNQMGNFNPSMAIVIVVLISIFFLLGFFSIYVRQCAGDSDGGGSFAARTLQAARSRRQRGLDPALLETFPTFVYSEVKGLKIGKGTLECAVCLSEFEDDENLRLLPKCSHVFHPECVDAWLSSHVTCPVCRANLAEPIEDSKSPAELLHASGTDAELVPDQPIPLPPPSPPEQVVITVDQEKESCEAEVEDEVAVLDRIGSQRRQARAAATGRPPVPAPPRRFPRSHSTGHSLVQPGGNLDRYTLRLPKHIRREILAASKLQRTKSFPANTASGDGSVRRGWRVAVGGEGSSRGWRSIRLGRSDRWPSFLVRTLSLSAWGSQRGNGYGETSVKKDDGEGSFKKSGSTRGVDGSEGSVRGKLFDCLGGAGAAMKAEGAAANESPTAPLARVRQL